MCLDYFDFFEVVEKELSRVLVILSENLWLIKMIKVLKDCYVLICLILKDVMFYDIDIWFLE